MPHKTGTSLVSKDSLEDKQVLLRQWPGIAHGVLAEDPQPPKVPYDQTDHDSSVLVVLILLNVL